MQQQADRSYSCNKYATLRFVVDPDRDVTIPVGVAIWGDSPDSLMLRLPVKGEKFKGVSVLQAIPYLQLVETQIRSWIKSDRVPYQHGHLAPLSDEWWALLRKLLKFRVQIDEPKAIECIRPEQELEALYEAVARPKQTKNQRRTRLDTAFNRAVGKELARRMSSGHVPGFGDKPVPVFRHNEGPGRHLVVELVNLATPQAETDADALASRVLRIKEGPFANQTEFLIGYIASPSGLNGEGVMKEWIEHKSGTSLLDVEREKDLFSSLLNCKFATPALPFE